MVFSFQLLIITHSNVTKYLTRTSCSNIGTSQAACFAVNFSPVRELPKSLGLMNSCASTWYTWYSNAYNPGWGHGFTTKNNVNAILYDRRKIHTHRNGRTDLASPYKVKVFKAVEKSPVQFVEVINASWHLNNWDICPDGRTFTYVVFPCFLIFFTRMSILSYVSLIYITRNSFEQQHSKSHSLKYYENSDTNARTNRYRPKYSSGTSIVRFSERHSREIKRL